MVHTLRQFCFTGQSSGPQLLITGGVHGDEFEPVAALRRLVTLFADRDGAFAEFQGRVTLVPVVNTAAFLRGHRCADDGLDLARVCPGRPDGSITEQTAHALSQLIRTADYYIDLHTGGTELSVFPLSGYTLHPEQHIRKTQRDMARAFNLPVVWGTAGNLDGRSLSVARDAGVPAIYCEYLGNATCSPAGVDAYVTGCLNVMVSLGMLKGELPPSQVRYEVEDPRPGSGHMQVQNPAPVDGYFEPAVRLGDEITAGRRLGTVFELDNLTPHSIDAEYDGLVLVLRTFPRVRAGDSIGVVMRLE